MLSPTDCGILFDLDGVIVDTKAAHFASFVKLGEEAGYTISEEQFRHVFGRRNNDIFPLLYGHPLSEEEIDRLSDRKEAIFREIIRGKVAPLPGVCALLPALRDAGFAIALGTSTPRANVDQILGELNLRQYFSGMVTAEDVTIGKPDPQVFLRAAASVHRQPARCVVVEDAVAGVQAALNGGMKALAVTTNHAREALSMAHRVVDSLAEVGPADFLTLIEG